MLFRSLEEEFDALAGEIVALRAEVERWKATATEHYEESLDLGKRYKTEIDAAGERVKMLYALLVEWADEVHIHTDEPCDVGPSCLMCRTAAALKATP